MPNRTFGCLRMVWDKTLADRHRAYAARGRWSATYPRSAFSYRDGALKLATMSDSLDIVWSRPLPDGAERAAVSLSRDPAGR